MFVKAFSRLTRLMIFALLALDAMGCAGQTSLRSRVIVPSTSVDMAGFARAEGPRAFYFPQDHGAHPNYLTEWWYYTGNLDASGGRHFGFQLTFFRRALLPPGQRIPRSSDWATQQVYMAHFALTDVSGGRYQAFERFSRGAAGLAGTQSAPFAVWLDDWQVRGVVNSDAYCANPQAKPCEYHLSAMQADLGLDLHFVDRKGPVLEGDRGYSRKGPDKADASYYYSLTRLETKGSLSVGGQPFQVSGWSWMDHEFSTSALSKQQVGWDWFSIQLDDDRELMVYQIRNADGTVDSFSSGTLIQPDGTAIPLQRKDFQLQVHATWKSPHSGAVYPAQWTLRLPTYHLELQIHPYLADQELNLSYAYWEGAVRVSGQQDGKPLLGDGYVELTGYSGSMGGQF